MTFDISDRYSVEFATLSPSADNYLLKILFKKTFERTLFLLFFKSTARRILRH